MRYVETKWDEERSYQKISCLCIHPGSGQNVVKNYMNFKQNKVGRDFDMWVLRKVKQNLTGKEPGPHLCNIIILEL